jgi:hypothetical protein
MRFTGKPAQEESVLSIQDVMRQLEERLKRGDLKKEQVPTPKKEVQ